MTIDIIVPPLSQTMDSLILLEWQKKVGEPVTKGETLFTVETDKATLEVESPATGIIYEVYAAPNTEVQVRSVIGKILEPGEETPQKGMKTGGIPEILKAEKMPISTSEETLRADKNKILNKNIPIRIFSSPRARRMAFKHSIDLSKIKPSGPRNMVIENDVRAFFEKHQEVSTTGLTPARKTIARRMIESHQTTAPVTYMSEADATELVKLRKNILKEIERKDVRLTYTDFFIKIVCLALGSYPDLNATFDGKVLTRYDHVHIALAVDTERGLLAPVIKDADCMSVRELSRQRNTIVERAIHGEINLSELRGGTFTVTNLGTMGIDHFTPIINPPQVAILAIGRIKEVPAEYQGKICLRSKVGLSVTCDHRIIDGAPAARFLKNICDLVDNPKREWV
ncbi:MAG TPA: 2-oxo acid dehydrogenase subunit E2 [Anaerolineae bacterium]|nr:2-oxo acid dehydrogenase subunit E2 [Anaerolineae bacterium]